MFSRPGVVHMHEPPTHWCELSHVSIVLEVWVCAVVIASEPPESSALELLESLPLSSPPSSPPQATAVTRSVGRSAARRRRGRVMRRSLPRATAAPQVTESVGGE